MRTIIFRGKRKDNGEWIEGFFVKRIEPLTLIPKCYILVQEEDTSCITREPTGRLNTEFSPYVVIPETISQYTGLKDKNGKRIFEGDILSILFEEDRSSYEENSIYYEKGEVYFDTERYGWYVRFREDNDEISLWEYDNTDIEVIGNIHDNPELMEIK